MSAPAIDKTALAESDLDEIWLHVALDNLVAADALLDSIGQHCQLLVEQPGLGRARPELAPGLRSFPVGRYVIFYRPAAAGGVLLVRVLHGARDVDAIASQEGFET